MKKRKIGINMVGVIKNLLQLQYTLLPIINSTKPVYDDQHPGYRSLRKFIHGR
jgi:hypothetical protein